MRDTIKGVVYDTKKALKLGEYRTEGDHGFCWCDEALYLSVDGNYFLAGSGGPGSRYRYSAEGVTSGGAGVVPISLKTAKAWAEEHMSPEERTEAFGQQDL